MGFAVVVLVLAGVFLVYHRDKPVAKRNPKELRTNLSDNVINFDPRVCDDSVSLQMAFFTYCGLTTINDQGEIIMDLADNYTVSDDHLTYRFTLKDLHWSDGSPLTAYDFEESWKEYTEEGFPASLCEIVTMIKGQKRGEPNGIKALDAKTIEIALTRPAPYFLQLLAHPTLFPVHKSTRGAFRARKRINPSDIVCSGPFRVKKYDSHEVILEKNAYYHRSSEMFLERVHMSCIKNPQTTLAMFEKGELDWLGGTLTEVPLDAIPDLKKKGKLRSYPILNSTFLYFNTSKYPLNNVNLRKALSYAIDREAITKEVLQRGDLPGLGYIPYIQKRERWHPFFRDRDIEEARRLFAIALKELDIDAANFPKITLSYNTLEVWYRVTQAIQQQWREALGIEVNIESAEWQVHMDRLRKGNFDIARSGRVGNFYDPLAFLQPLLSHNALQNFCRWDNKDYDKIVQDSDSIADKEERRGYLERAEELIMEEMPVAPLLYFNAYSIQQDDLEGVAMTPQWYVDFTKAHFKDQENGKTRTHTP